MCPFPYSIMINAVLWSEHEIISKSIWVYFTTKFKILKIIPRYNIFDRRIMKKMYQSFIICQNGNHIARYFSIHIFNIKYRNIKRTCPRKS